MKMSNGCPKGMRANPPNDCQGTKPKKICLHGSEGQSECNLRGAALHCAAHGAVHCAGPVLRSSHSQFVRHLFQALRSS